MALFSQLKSPEKKSQFQEGPCEMWGPQISGLIDLHLLLSQTVIASSNQYTTSKFEHDPPVALPHSGGRRSILTLLVNQE
jgi:hypothetical protein